MTDIVELKKVNKVFGTNHVVSDLDLSVKEPTGILHPA